MIVYRKGTSMRVLLRATTLRKAIKPALVAAILTALIDQLVPEKYLIRLFEHPYPFQPFASLVAFALVFRTNAAYNRYWEVAREVATMSARWADAIAELIAYDESGAADEDESSFQARREAQLRFLHLGSLMHALALQYLRRDDKLDLLCPADLSRASIVEPAASRANISEKRNTVLSATRESARLLVRWLPWHKVPYATPSIPVIAGLEAGEAAALSRTDERVALVNCMLLKAINQRRAAGGLRVEAPILAGVYRELATGTAGFRQAQKVEDLPFPFAYQQVVLFLVYTFTITFPLLAAAKLGSESGDSDIAWLAPLIAFLTNLANFGLLRVAQELEDPFVHPPNDLPSLQMQHTFNLRCLAAWDALQGSNDVPPNQSPEVSPAGTPDQSKAEAIRALRQLRERQAMLIQSGSDEVTFRAFVENARQNPSIHASVGAEAESVAPSAAA